MTDYCIQLGNSLQWRSMDDILLIKDKLDKLIITKNFSSIGESNPKIKQIKGIISNTKPNPEKLFIAEGIWIYKKLIEFNTFVKSIIICPELIYTFEAVSLLEKLTENVNDCYIVSSKTYEKISERDKPDGLMAIAMLPSCDINSFKHTVNSTVLVLDGVEIPGNIGTMLRMADGAGLDALLICNRRARLTHPKLIKGSMGAVLTVPIYEFIDVAACKKWLSNNNYTVYLTDTRATKYYFEEQFNCNTALVMGSERYGITREWYDETAKLISIPMLGKCDSLNVGVAATVIAYEAAIKNKLLKK